MLDKSILQRLTWDEEQSEAARLEARKYEIWLPKFNDWGYLIEQKAYIAEFKMSDGSIEHIDMNELLKMPKFETRLKVDGSKEDNHTKLT